MKIPRKATTLTNAEKQAQYRERKSNRENYHRDLALVAQEVAFRLRTYAGGSLTIEIPASGVDPVGFYRDLDAAIVKAAQGRDMSKGK